MTHDGALTLLFRALALAGIRHVLEASATVARYSGA